MKHGRSAWIALILLGALSLAQAQAQAQDAPRQTLSPGKDTAGELSAGQAQSYAIRLNAGDYFEAKVTTKGAPVIIAIRTPDGPMYRGFRGTPIADTQIFFVAESGEGLYRVEFRHGQTASPQAVPAAYQITEIKTLSSRQRLVEFPASRELTGPRIQALRQALESKTPNAISEFWEEVKKQGTPLIEPIEGDSAHRLVTFLWRGTPQTSNVLVALAPRFYDSMAAMQMSRLDGADVWYKTLRLRADARFVYELAPDMPVLTKVDFFDRSRSLLFATRQADPLNLHPFPPPSANQTRFDYRSSVEMPNAPPQPWIVKKPEVAAGTVKRSFLESKLLKNQRAVIVYTPAGYSKEAGPYNAIFVFDGPLFTASIPGPVILDNLIAAKRIPPTVAVLVGVGNGPGDVRLRELGCNPAFADFLRQELLTWVREEHAVTSDARRIAIAGVSLGGLASACAAFRHSEIFGNVISMSGSYGWIPPSNPDQPFVRDEEKDPNWLAAQFVKTPRLPVRFYLGAGSEEDGLGPASLLSRNRHLRDVLLAKGYEVHYQEFAGGHDTLSWRGTFADALIELFGPPREPR